MQKNKSFNIESKIICPGLIHFSFDTTYEVSSTMLRLQEFYESPYPEIRGQYFTLDQYMDCYAAEMGNFTYTSDWSGFNVPGNIVNKYFEEFKEKLLFKEINLANHLLPMLKHHASWDKYYIIASSKEGGKVSSGEDIMRHEVAHGLWYLNQEYRREQSTVVDNIKADTFCIAEKLEKMGYYKDMIDDEIHAYFATSSMTYLANKGFSDCNIPWEHVLECQIIFEKYYEELVEEGEE